MSKYFLCFLSVLTAAFSVAMAPLDYSNRTDSLSSKEVGNGGDVVVCRNEDGTIKGVYLLDYYEWSPRMKIDLGPESLSVEEKVNLALDRLAEVDAHRAETYRKWAGEFMKEALLLPGVELRDIPDSNHIAVPKGCSIDQLVIQQEPKFKEGARYTISSDLWDPMSNTDKAGTILHEIIYRDLTTQEHHRHHNSVAARYFNSAIAANKLRDLKTARDVVEFYVRLSFDDVTIQGAFIDIRHERAPSPDEAVNAHSWNRIAFYKDQKLAEAPIVERSKMILFGNPIRLCGNKTIKFHENGSVKSLTSCSGDKINLNVGGRDFVFVSDTQVLEGFSEDFYVLHFYDNGVPERMGLGEFTRFTTPQYDLMAHSMISFYRDGQVRSVRIDEKEQKPGEPEFRSYVMIQGRRIDIGSHRLVQFYPDGSIELADVEDARIQFTSGGAKVTLAGQLGLYPNQNIKSGWLAQDSTLRDKNGKKLKCQRGVTLFFDAEGSLERFESANGDYSRATCREAFWQF